MKKSKYSIFLLVLFFLISACQDVKKGFSGKKIDQGEEFLVIKKNPLIVPPDFEKLPSPKDENNNVSSAVIEKDLNNNFEKLLKNQNKNIETPTSKKNTGNLEKKIIDKIK